MVRDRGATPQPAAPPFAPPGILPVLQGCWQKDEKDRLTFSQIHAMLHILLRDANIVLTSAPPSPPPPAHPADCGGNAAAAIGQVEIEIHLADDEVDAAMATENNRVPPPHADYVNVPSSSFLRLPPLKRSVASASGKDEIKERTLSLSPPLAAPETINGGINEAAAPAATCQVEIEIYRYADDDVDEDEPIETDNIRSNEVPLLTPPSTPLTPITEEDEETCL